LVDSRRIRPEGKGMYKTMFIHVYGGSSFLQFRGSEHCCKGILVVGEEEYSDLSYLGVFFSRFNLCI
jgi:hypothetical protein